MLALVLLPLITKFYFYFILSAVSATPYCFLLLCHRDLSGLLLVPHSLLLLPRVLMLMLLDRDPSPLLQSPLQRLACCLGLGRQYLPLLLLLP